MPTKNLTDMFIEYIEDEFDDKVNEIDRLFNDKNSREDCVRAWVEAVEYFDTAASDYLDDPIEFLFHSADLDWRCAILKSIDQDLIQQKLNECMRELNEYVNDGSYVGNFLRERLDERDAAAYQN